MPWSRSNYPATFKNMTSPVRDKAIDIANELLNQYDEGRAIRIATAQAKEWARRRDMEIWTDGEPNGRDQHVVAHERGWAVQPEGAQQATKVFPSRDEAAASAREIARNQHSHVVLHGKNGRIEDVLSVQQR
jgi:uncharacterized protein YdaT